VSMQCCPTLDESTPATAFSGPTHCRSVGGWSEFVVVIVDRN